MAINCEIKSQRNKWGLEKEIQEGLEFFETKSKLKQVRSELKKYVHKLEELKNNEEEIDFFTGSQLFLQIALNLDMFSVEKEWS